MNKIVRVDILIHWDDGEVVDISHHVPEGICQDLETYLDYLEEQENEGKEDES